jgi:TonB family protein
MKPYTLSRLILCLTVFLVAFSPLNAGNERKKNGKVKTTHANGTKASQGKVKNYQKQGTWKYWNEKGVFVKAATYKNDLLNGEYVELFDGKQKATEGTYLNGQRNGSWNEWYTDGKQRSRLNYANGQFNGTQQYWYENSNLREEAVYENGMLQSRKTWYYSGRPRKVEYYRNGKREGQWRDYDEFATDTLPTLLQTYSNDLLNGPMYRYSKGRRTEEATYLNGRLNGTLRRWDDNGNLGLEENYSSGNLNGECRYLENGILLRSGNYLNGAKNGMFTENNREGLLLRHIWYTRGREDSVYSYHPNGKIAIRKTAISGITLTETYQEFNEAGLLMLNGNYLSTKKQGVWTSYYPNGKKKSETPYARGAVTGIYRKWHANGKLLIEMDCRNGATVSQPKIWNDAGKQLKPTDKEYIALLESSMPGDVYDDPSRYNAPRRRPDNNPPVFEEIIGEERINTDGDAMMVMEEPMPAKEQGDQVLMFAEEMPEFPGGTDSLRNYLNRMIRYPELAKEAGVQGTVYINFTVEKDGSLTNVNVIKGIKEGMGLNEEAVRVVKGMPNWKPGKMNGRPVRVNMNIPVRFRLD